MQNGLNRIFLMGRLGSDPRVQFSKNGRAYTTLRLATQRPFKKEDGQWDSHTDWHSVTVWGQSGEHCARHLSRGQAVLVEGYVNHYDRHLDSGQNIKQTAITAKRVEFLTPRSRPADSVISDDDDDDDEILEVSTLIEPLIEPLPEADELS